MTRDSKGKTWTKKTRGIFFSAVCVMVFLSAFVHKMFVSELLGIHKEKADSHLFKKNDISSAASCSRSLMFITVSGGINNQILAAINALAIAKYLNLTIVVPTFTKLRTSRPVTFDPVPLSTYFEEEIFIERVKQQLGLTVLPFTNLDKSTTLEIPATSGQNFYDIIRAVREGLDSSKYCNVEVLNQWGIRWPRSAPAMHEYLDVFVYKKELLEIARNFKEKFLSFPYNVVHARVEDTSPSVYFRSDFEEGRRDEVAGIAQHLQKFSLDLPIFVASGVKCTSELFQTLRDAGYKLYCMNTFHHFFESSETESYVKSCIDSIISLDSEHFVGRYASSASYIMKIKRSLVNKTSSMYCSKSGFMCNDCGLACLSHRGVRRHYKSLRDVENCFFLPKCGLLSSSCIDKSFSDGSYTCKMESKEIEIQDRKCNSLKNLINSQDGFKTWFHTCKKGLGKHSCPKLLNFNCA